MLQILETVSCGGLENIDIILPTATSMVVNAIKIVIPILLIIFGMLDLGKAVMSNDEKEMKGAQTKFIKRILYAVIIFFIVAVVQLVFGMLGSASVEGSDNAMNCIDCFISGPGKNGANCK